MTSKPELPGNGGKDSQHQTLPKPQKYQSTEKRQFLYWSRSLNTNHTPKPTKISETLVVLFPVLSSSPLNPFKIYIIIFHKNHFKQHTKIKRPWVLSPLCKKQKKIYLVNHSPRDSRMKSSILAVSFVLSVNIKIKKKETYMSTNTVPMLSLTHWFI